MSDQRAAVATLAELPGLPRTLRELYGAFYARAVDPSVLPPRIAALCRLRIAQLHDYAAPLPDEDDHGSVTADDADALPGWRAAERFSAQERTALAVAEKLPWQHHDITDAEMAALRDALGGDPPLVALMTALALFDANCRLGIVFRTASG